ncbi:tryptophan synthase subunit alpha [Exiguobacterium flavidum]|uniref:tryptophan synthase subunit alpha n=1 Tax=Exiguobacterium flavidum TaxID=2184695 RepID=UPI000DF85F4F|nr:tryptophan synthase subunit alpha [Exiguobacterium flavidum]
MRLEQAIRTVTDRGEKAFIPYIMGGDGGLDKLGGILTFLEEAGATAIEIGVPFSDPVADGPVIQKAGQRALAEGTTLEGLLAQIERIRQDVHIPLILMTYLNPVLQLGVDHFFDACASAGVDGLIIPDLPLEQGRILFDGADRRGVALIQLASLTSPRERLEQIAQSSEGFLYAVTVNGTTGGRNTFSGDLEAHLKAIEAFSPVPVLAGFGISTPDHVREVSRHVSGVIVGSKIVELLEEGRRAEIELLVAARKATTVN